MFDRYTIEYKDNSLEAAARVTAEMELDRKSREKIAEKEIKARDRVDITLEEYENMKKEIEKLRDTNRFFKAVFDRIEIPWDKNIVVDSVGTFENEDCMNFRRTYLIRLSVDEMEFS